MPKTNKKRKKVVQKKKVQKPEPANKDIFTGVKKTKIKVIGIGGGGCSIVSEISSKVKKASFVVANTDIKALRSTSQKTIKFQFGQNLTRGLGTGMNPVLAEEAAQNEKEKIKKLLSGADFCILVISLGGGAGSGAAPVFAKISKELGNITYGIVTLPFKFEGDKKTEIAKNSLEKLRPNLNAFSVIPNDRIFQVVDKDTPLKEALSQINKALAESLEGLIETIYQPGLINIDFADLKTILEGRGRLAYLNTVEAQGPAYLDEGIKSLLASPLYPYTIQGARAVLLNIIGKKGLSLEEISEVSKTISQMVNKEAKIIFGLSQSSKSEDKIKINLLATGCQTKIFASPPKPADKKNKTDSDQQVKPKPVVKKPKKKKPVKMNLKKEKPKINTFKKQPKKEEKKEEEVKILKKPKIKPKKKTKPKLKKIKIKVFPEAEKKEVKNLEKEIVTQNRKNALQVKKQVEDEEQEMLAREKIWETPAFLRKQQSKS